MISRKQVRIHQKKEKKKQLKLRMKKVCKWFLSIVVSKIVTGILGHVLNSNNFFDLIKELFLIISNSRYKFKRGLPYK